MSTKLMDALGINDKVVDRSPVAVAWKIIVLRAYEHGREERNAELEHNMAGTRDALREAIEGLRRVLQCETLWKAKQEADTTLDAIEDTEAKTH